MPSIIAPITVPPQKQFYNNIASADTHARHFVSVGLNHMKAPNHQSSKQFSEFSASDLPSVNSSPHNSSKFSLSENAKFFLCCFMWYLSSSLSSNTGKLIMNVFKYPVTLTFVQFFLVACWCATMENIFKSKGIKRPTKVIAQTIIPLSSFMIFGHIFSSISISRIPVSLVHTIKALSPLFTVLFYRFIFKVRYSSKVYTALIPLTMGVILACSFTFSNNVIGLACALASCLIFVMQNIFNKKVLFKEAKMGDSNPNKLDKMNVMFYSSSFAFILMSPIWLYSDGFRFLNLDTSLELEVTQTRLICYFLLNGTTHFAQSWFAFTTLSMSSPVTYSIASLVKRIFVIVISILWFGQQVKITQGLGIVSTFAGLWMYQSAKREVDQGENKVSEKSLEILPTSNTNVKSS